MEPVYNKLFEYGLLGIVLVGVVIYFLRREKKLEALLKTQSERHAAAMAAKDTAHAEVIKEKDAKIDDLVEKNHHLALNGQSTMKDWIDALRNLTRNP